VIADLSVNHVERQALLCGHSVERVLRDYGIDLRVYTFDSNGEVENGYLQFQLKATDHPKVVSRGQAVTVRVERADLRAWLHEPMPVVLVLYDASADRAYWLYVQEYFEQARSGSARRSTEVTIRIRRNNVLNPDAIQHLARCRDRIMAQTKGRLRHHE
jgi:hypothetical protein